LDFTVLNVKLIEPKQLATIFFEISEWLYYFTGIELLYEKSTFELHKEGSCQGKFIIVAQSRPYPRANYLK
jgi:hypothetical protein